MYRRKLEALEYHNYANFDGNSEEQFRALVLWLEDQKIRHYKIEDRDALRDVTSPNWPNAFEKYCTDIESPINSADKHEHLEWLLGFAVRLIYEDNLEKYSNRTSERVKSQKSDAPQVKSTNPLDNLDFGSEDFKNGVKALGELLKVSSHPDPLVTLHAVSTLVTNLSSQEKTNFPKTGTPFPIMEADLGFDLGDYVLNQASRVLRLLYVHDLRSLQTCINEAIVGVQNLTADPKTDTKLGKVGR